MRIALVVTTAATMLFGACAHAAQCAATSGPNTTALVELYTSEGCSSCPPADRWLSGLARRGYGPQRVVPLALHVNYWDYIGWKDPYAKREFSVRQRKLTQLQRLALVYTPQVMLQGRDFRGWGTSAFDDAVAGINARPARARLELQITSASPHVLMVRASAEVLDPAQVDESGLYLAAYENRLESRVTAGENRGRTLAHDHVVLQWAGPVRFAGLRLEAERALALLPGALAANSGVVAFVQNRRTAEVLQALLLATCP
jgi:hypothetical protein